MQPAGQHAAGLRRRREQRTPSPSWFFRNPQFLPWRLMNRVDLPSSNLRAVVILIVVAFHSALPYLASQPPQPYAFDAAPYRWVAFPIVDHERWFGFDLFCAWQDVSLMSLMFFLA